MFTCLAYYEAKDTVDELFRCAYSFRSCKFQQQRSAGRICWEQFGGYFLNSSTMKAKELLAITPLKLTASLHLKMQCVYCVYNCSKNVYLYIYIWLYNYICILYRIMYDIRICMMEASIYPTLGCSTSRHTNRNHNRRRERSTRSGWRNVHRLEKRPKMGPTCKQLSGTQCS